MNTAIDPSKESLMPTEKVNEQTSELNTKQDEAWQRTGFARRGRAWYTGMASGVSPACRVMLLALADSANDRAEINWTTEAQIHVSGLPRRTALRALKTLRSQGLISTERKADAGKSVRARFKTIMMHQWDFNMDDTLQLRRLELSWLIGRMAFLAPRDLLVYVAFNSLCCDWYHGYSTLTNEFIAEESGVDLRRIKGRDGALSRLVDAGLLKRVGKGNSRVLTSFSMPDDAKTEVKNLRAMWKSTKTRGAAGKAKGGCQNGTNWVSKWHLLGVNLALTGCQNGTRTHFLTPFITHILNSDPARQGERTPEVPEPRQLGLRAFGVVEGGQTKPIALPAPQAETPVCLHEEGEAEPLETYSELESKAPLRR